MKPTDKESKSIESTSTSETPPMQCYRQHLARDGHVSKDFTCKRGSVGQNKGLLIPRSSVRFRLRPKNSNSRGFELHRPSLKCTKLLLKVMKAITIIIIPGVDLLGQIYDSTTVRLAPNDAESTTITFDTST